MEIEEMRGGRPSWRSRSATQIGDGTFTGTIAVHVTKLDVHHEKP